MEATQIEDPFGEIIKFCIPTASQEAKFQICPLARESENFAESNPDPFSSSLDLTPSQPTGIIMLSVPASPNSVEQEDNSVFHTPPEQHLHSHLSSSEDQNPDVTCADWIVDLQDDVDKSKKDMAFEGQLDDELKSERIRGPEEEFFVETLPADETEPVVIKDGNEIVNNDEVIILDSDDSDEEANTLNLGEDSPAKTGKDINEVNKINAGQNINGEKGLDESSYLVRGGVHAVNFFSEQHEPRKNSDLVKDTVVIRDGKSCESNVSVGSLSNHKMEEDVVKIKRVAGTGHVRVREESGVNGSCEVPIINNKKISEDKGSGTCEEDKIQEMEKSNLDDGMEIENRRKGKADGAGGVSGKKRQLPATVKGNEKNAEIRDVPDPGEKKRGLLDILDDVKRVLGDKDGANENEDFLETAKNRGMTFPRPRWWSPDGDDEPQS